MAIITMMITATLGMGLWALPAMIATLVLGPSTAINAGTDVIIAGLMLHMILSMMFALIYAAIVNLATHEFVATAIAFGLALWVFNFYVIGLVLPGARMMTQQEPVWLAILSHLVFGASLGMLARASIRSPRAVGG